MMELIKASMVDCKEIHRMQLRSFQTLLEKYKDVDTNPGSEPLDKIEKRMKQEKTDYYFITVDHNKIGIIRVVRLDHRECRISPLFILPEYQGHGYAQQALKTVESLYPEAEEWSLETIKEEAKLCHLYEKMGYLKTGKEEKVQDNMTLLLYYKMTDVYQYVPVYENEDFLIRKLDSTKDLKDLYQVYSDKNAVRFFNADNCHGDTFYYDTMEKMKKAVDFWDFSYGKKYFVRFSVVDKISENVIGTIELFHRDAEDYFKDCGLLRLDLRSDYETEAAITSILDLIVPPAYQLFHCSMVATKAVSTATKRITALQKSGFVSSDHKLIGNDGTNYGDYFVRRV